MFFDYLLTARCLEWIGYWSATGIYSWISVYLTDLANFIHCKLKLFADDVTLYHQIVSHEDCLHP